MLRPSGKILRLPDLIAGHCIVEGFRPSQVMFLHRPAARTEYERNPSQVNTKVKASKILTYRNLILDFSLCKDVRATVVDNHLLSVCAKIISA